MKINKSEAVLFLPIMPGDFDKCVKEGGRVRTINRKPNEYQHICYSHGKSHAGEVKHTKPASNSNTHHHHRHSQHKPK